VTPADVLVWTAQVLYLGRFLVQWLASERAGRSVAPRVFWWLSLIAVLLLGAGVGLDGLWILLPACCVNAAIYAHNLLRREGSGSRLGPLAAAGLGGLAAVALLATQLDSTSDAWAGLPPAILVSALVGQAIWSVRFPLQWLLSERAGRTHFPLAFWWLSLAGAGCNLAYTGWLGEPKYIVGYVLAWLVPLRNLALEYRRRASAPRSAEEPTRRSP